MSLSIQRYDESEESDHTEPTFKTPSSLLPQPALKTNALLLFILTNGPAFFYLPWRAKLSGIFLTIIVIIITSCASYMSSQMLYFGYRATKAKSYDEVMRKVMGGMIGYLSNWVMLAHTMAAVISSWIFSYKFLVVGLFEENSAVSIEYAEHFKLLYFLGTFLMVFYVTLRSNVDRLKPFTFVGVLILAYIVIVFASESSAYHNYYSVKEPLEVKWAVLDHHIIKTFGICSYLFTNQYSIIPLVDKIEKHNLKRVNFILSSTTVSLIILYILIIFIGYFSLPNIRELNVLDRHFLMRKAIPERSDDLIIIGRCLFGVYLLLCLLIKVYFLMLYFSTMIDQTKLIMEKKVKINGPSTNPESIPHDIEYSQINQSKPLDTAKDIEQTKLKETSVVDEDQRQMIYNFFFIGGICLLSMRLLDHLSSFLCLAGSIVGMFEMIILPLMMAIWLDRTKKKMSFRKKVVLVCGASVFLVLCTSSFILSIRSGM